MRLKQRAKELKLAAGIFRTPVGVALIIALLGLAGCPAEQEKQTDAQAPPAGQTADDPAADSAADAPPTAIRNEDPVTDTTGMELEEFAETIIGDFNAVWTAQFGEHGRGYNAPELKWFDGSILGVCGFEQAAGGPFYCAEDATLYLDRPYLEALRSEDAETGELAAAYAIAHHLAHHVQNLLTYTEEIENMKATLDEEKAADLVLRYELQADFFAGMWMHHAGLLPAEMTEDSAGALLATISAVAKKRVGAGLCDFEPDPLTHGAAEQRQYWLWRGYDTGDISYSGTYAADQL